MVIKSRKITNNCDGIGPLVLLLVIGGLAIAGVSAYQIFSRPDITYNISETGLSFAGGSASWIIIAAVGFVVVFIFFMLFRRKPGQIKEPMYYIPTKSKK